jgi:hypothetical protein
MDVGHVVLHGDHEASGAWHVGFDKYLLVHAFHDIHPNARQVREITRDPVLFGCHEDNDIGPIAMG